MSKFIAIVSLAVVAVSSLANPPVKNSRTAELAIKDGQLVISAAEVKWGWIEKPQGTVISINDNLYLRHDQNGAIRLVGAVDIGDGCYWTMKLVRSDKERFNDEGNKGENFYERYALTPRDPKLKGWGMTFSRGVLCLQADTESRPHFLSQFCVYREIAGEPEP